MLRGKKDITGWGAWLVSNGIARPVFLSLALWLASFLSISDNS